MVSAVFLLSCGKSDVAAASHLAAAPDGWADASALFIDAQGETVGEVHFKQTPLGGVLTRISMRGLSEGWHGVHLHQAGDCSDGADGFKASGGHINPDHDAHGLLNPDGNEPADLVNIYAGADGVAVAEIYNDMVSLGGGGPLQDADGFAVIVHQNPDDHMTQPIGGAGARIACAAVSGTE